MKLAERLIALFEMSLEDARKILGVSGDTDIDKAWKKAAMKHHPDRGGDVEVMKKVNQAYELLKKSGGSGSISSMSREEQKAYWDDVKKQSAEREKANKIKVESMLKDFSTNFKSQIPFYNEHFKDFFELQEPKIVVKLAGPWGGSYQGIINVVWPTSNGSTEIRLNIKLWPEESKGLGFGDEVVYRVSYETSLYHNKKAHKMARRDYQWGKTSTDALNPEKVFPKAKLKKVVAKAPVDKMTKKSFYKGILAELKAYKPDAGYTSADFIFDFKRDDKLFLSLNRSVWNRQPIWHTKIYRNSSPEGKSPWLKYMTEKDVLKALPNLGGAYLGIPETATGLDLLKDYLNKFIKNKKISKDHFKPAWDKLDKKNENLGEDEMSLAKKYLEMSEAAGEPSVILFLDKDGKTEDKEETMEGESLKDVIATAKRIMKLHSKNRKSNAVSFVIQDANKKVLHQSN